jgi:hypothetical protein
VVQIGNAGQPGEAHDGQPPHSPPSQSIHPTYPADVFAKGQKVVCINDEFPPMALLLFKHLPKKDVVYTVRAIYIGRGSYTKAETGKKDGEIGVLLEELVNPRDPALKQGLNGELGFNSERFAPLQTTEDELEGEATEKDEDFVLLPA